MRARLPPRYRLEGGRTCIDIKLRNADQLFDIRDPAPFRERDLDDDAVEYILGAVQEIAPKASIKMVFWIAGPPQLPAEAFVEAVRAHFRYEIGKLTRRVREHVRQGQLALIVGLAVLALFLTLAQLTNWLPAGTATQILREGLIITGWVAMWRPLELLLYDWWPMVRQRRLCQRVADAEITVEPGATST
ncbi:MAG: hypothetical protein ABI565_13195 [Vicinamibacteria bacterium]